MIVLFNPRSTSPGKQPLPLSVMSLAAVLEARPPGRFGTWTLVDGNLIADPAAEILARVASAPAEERSLLAVTVMPGPQLTEAVTICRRVKMAAPQLPIVWGGYFPTQHADTVLRSTFVDFAIRSQGERPLLELIDALAAGGAVDAVSGLSWTANGRAMHNPIGAPIALDDLPDLPYQRIDMAPYIQPNYLGRRTLAYNSSFGCPFSCSFCAVVAMSNRRWIAQSPARMERVLRRLVAEYRIDAIQMHDMDFFISEARTAEFCERIADLQIGWWGLGRVDTLMHYSEETWRKMARSGLKMVFSGAESGTDQMLAAMNKGGTASTSLTLELAARARRHRIVPEFSFVLGCPPEPLADVARTFEFIREIKEVNPATEVILYTYTPVPLAGGLYEDAQKEGFRFPETLDEWASPEWQQLSLRRGDGIPWMQTAVRRRVRNFERVVNAFYPTVTDPRLTQWRRTVLRAFGGWRYAFGVYGAPFELVALQRLMRYQRPETTGF
jgi:anaerobic magnesium-protoporphyrin IX monomethyl ester cyclase